MTSSKRTAVLVDGDNVAAALAGQIVDLSNKGGAAAVLRVYTNARRSDGWHDQPAFRMIHGGAGKNATDMLLCVDAMELALRDGIERFFLASSDGDFSHLARRLRELGRQVIGVGTQQASVRFRAACGAFEVLDAAKAAPNLPNGPTDQDRLIRDIIAVHSQKGEGLALIKVDPNLRSKGLKLSQLGAKSYRAYFNARPSLYEIHGTGKDTKIRFKPSGFATSAG